MHGAWDPVSRGALRDRVIRQVRQVILKLEDGEATAQLREAVSTLPSPELITPSRANKRRCSG
jgi:hypothetical protein